MIGYFQVRFQSVSVSVFFSKFPSGEERRNERKPLTQSNCFYFKVQKARELKDDLIQQRQQHLDEKQRRAEQQRLLVIQEIVRKAQEEDAKVPKESTIH